MQQTKVAQQPARKKQKFADPALELSGAREEEKAERGNVCGGTPPTSAASLPTPYTTLVVPRVIDRPVDPVADFDKDESRVVRANPAIPCWDLDDLTV